MWENFVFLVIFDTCDVIIQLYWECINSTLPSIVLETILGWPKKIGGLVKDMSFKNLFSYFKSRKRSDWPCNGSRFWGLLKGSFQRLDFGRFDVLNLSLRKARIFYFLSNIKYQIKLHLKFSYLIRYNYNYLN